jgi:Ni,Fe-hydrogenase I large subunit
VAQEGRIDVTVHWAQGRCVDVDVTSTRRIDVWRSLEGRPPGDALVLAPLLSSICSTAHGLAGLEAVEAALGVEVDDVQRSVRRALVSSEVLQNHLWFWLLSAPELMGEAPDAATLRLARAQLAEVQAAMGLALPWVRVGGTSLTPNPERLAVSLDALSGLLAPLGLSPSLVGAFDDLPRLPGRVGAVLRYVLNGPLATVGVTTPREVTLEPTRVQQELETTPGFAARPTWEGRPLELGPLHSSLAHPLVRVAVEKHGHGLVARLVARYVETCAILHSHRMTAQNVRASTVARASPQGSGQGVGVAPTSRGPVVHAVHVEQGQIVAWRVVAPTEWTFHPHGAVREALIGLSAPDVQSATRWSRWVVATLDPCVACEVHVRERDDARGGAGTEHR